MESHVYPASKKQVKYCFPPRCCLLQREKKTFLPSVYVPVAPSPSDGESSADSIVCSEIGGWRETGVPSAVPALGPSGQCCAAALKTGTMCSVAREHVENAILCVVGCGQHADTGKLLLHWMTHTNTHTQARAHTPAAAPDLLIPCAMVCVCHLCTCQLF